MSGLGDHREESRVLIHVTREVEIGKEARETAKERTNSRSGAWKRGERSDETNVVRYQTLRTRLGRHGGIRRGKLEFGENDAMPPGHCIWRSQPGKWHGMGWAQSWALWTSEIKSPPGWSPLREEPLSSQQSVKAHPRGKSISTTAVSKWKFQGQFNRPKNFFFFPSPFQQRIQAWKSISVTCVFQKHFWDHLSAARSLTSETLINAPQSSTSYPT